MATETKKTEVPAYSPYPTFKKLINDLRSTGIPDRIDRSVLSKMSGSGKAAMTTSLRALDLTNQEGVPKPKLDKLVAAEGEDYAAVLAQVLKEAYPFMQDNSLNMAKTTGAQLEQRFREFGITGSTVVKAMNFFIAAAKDAKIELSSHIRPPKHTSSNGTRRSAKNKNAESQADVEAVDDADDGGPPSEIPGMLRIVIPLHGMEDGVVFLPDGLSPAQWRYALKITQFLLENYRHEDSAEGGAS